MIEDKIEFTNGFITGWAFAVGECHRAALDIKTVQKTTGGGGKPVLHLGKNFSFSVGDTIWDHPEGHTAETWAEALPYITYGLQVRAAAPAGLSNKCTFLHGSVTADVYKKSNSKKKVRLFACLKCTQAEFVKTLKDGLNIESLEVI